MARARKKYSLVFLVSVGAHLVVGAALALIPQDKIREVVGIAFTDAPKPKPAAPKSQPHPAKDSPRRAPRTASASRAASPAAKSEAENASSPVFADLGISLDSSAIGGIAVPVAARATAQPILATVAPKAPKVFSAVGNAGCNEELVKATPDRVARAEYTNEARAADIEGRVRLELTIDETGVVTDVKVLSGLGHGLDEQAKMAAKKMHFKPATKCGKPVPSSFVLATRFTLGS